MKYEKNEHGDKILVKNLIERRLGVLYYVTGKGDIGAIGMTKDARKIVKNMKTVSVHNAKEKLK